MGQVQQCIAADLLAMPQCRVMAIGGIPVQRKGGLFQIAGRWLTRDSAIEELSGALMAKRKSKKVESTSKPRYQAQPISPLEPAVPRFPAQLRAITIHAPYCYLILEGFKPEEYRNRPTKQRGWVLIHSGKSHADDVALEYQIPTAELVYGAIVGAAWIEDCYLDEYDTGYAYQLLNPIRFPVPIEARGKQMVFWPANGDDEIRIFNTAWDYIKAWCNQEGVALRYPFLAPGLPSSSNKPNAGVPK